MMKLAVLLVAGVIAQAYGDAPEAIVGGTAAVLGQIPYQVSLQTTLSRLRERWSHICGGSIATKQHIITAAHCVTDVKNVKKLTVVTATITQPDGGVRHKVKRIFIHPNYTDESSSGWKNDIAVILLEEPMVFNENQKPIPVATQDYATGDFTGIVSGFGAPGAGKDSTEKLQYVEVKVLSQPECLASQRPYTNPKHICSLERFGKGFCQGDSGGPLMVNGELSGVVSWNLPCARGVSDVYTNVYYYLDFIKECLQKFE